MSEQQNTEATQVDETGMTPAECEAIKALRDRGYCVIIWTPEEVGTADIEGLEDVVITHGNHHLDEINNRNSEDEQEQE